MRNGEYRTVQSIKVTNFTSQSPIEEDEEQNPPTMGEATMDTQVINTDLDAQDLTAFEGIHRNSCYNLRPRRERDYSHLHVILDSLVMTVSNA